MIARVAPGRILQAIALAALALAATPALAQIAQIAQSVRMPAGPQAAHIHRLWLLLLAVCAVVEVAVTIATIVAVVRTRRADAATPPDVAALERDERPVRHVVVGAVALTAATLVALVAASVHTDRALASLPLTDALHVELTGYQWWWEATYDDAQPSRVFRTANELHVPTGRPVVFTLKSSDVIHSVWIPNLAGKKDLIPGQTITFTLRADQPGVYRGQCAEFCGYQHAKMALFVVAEAPDAYERWADRQRQPAAMPAEGPAARGRAVFEQGSCAMCHAVQGTIAQARTGPDLTHVASRATIAAGVLANTPQNRAAWIQDPQSIKPGTNMPANALTEADLVALLAYLDTLK